jgi:hypothetical protein
MSGWVPKGASKEWAGIEVVGLYSRFQLSLPEYKMASFCGGGQVIVIIFRNYN